MPEDPLQLRRRLLHLSTISLSASKLSMLTDNGATIKQLLLRLP
jgi:hypothetical protein